MGASGAGFEPGRALGSVAGDQAADPGLGHPVAAGDLGLGTALDDNSSDYEASLRHTPAS